MPDLDRQITAVFARRRLPLDSLQEFVHDLRREGRALTPGALLRLLERDRAGVRLLRPWRGVLAPLAPGRARPCEAERSRGTVDEEAHLTLVVGRLTPWGPEGREPGWPRVARAVVHLAREVDEASVLARARWLQIHDEARRLAA
jgi:hypothetical protein